jgi:hypothetical protein
MGWKLEAVSIPAPAADAAALSGHLTGPAAGPLVVSEANPRYFTVAAGDAADRRVVYLTGSHANNNFHDGSGPGADCAETPEPNDFRAYLEFLKERGHNFIRLWRWEQFKSQVAGGAFHFCMTPQPWPRTGPGTAKDGKPRFDLSMFDPAYFDRLRDYVVAAGDEGIYVSVMLFEGFGLHLSLSPDNVEGHPFHAANNVNGIGFASINDYQVLRIGLSSASYRVLFSGVLSDRYGSDVRLRCVSRASGAAPSEPLCVLHMARLDQLRRLEPATINTGGGCDARLQLQRSAANSERC